MRHCTAIRRDGSSLTLSNSNKCNFPSFGLGRKSMKTLKRKSKYTLKLRGGWGRLGNQNVSN
jgi:hypothetical protein